MVVLYVFLHSARVSRGVRHSFLTMFTYCVRLVCHSFTVSYFHRKTKMLPHKLFKCGRGIFNTNFTLTLHHADITTHDETTFHLDEKSRHVLISRDLVIRDFVTPLVCTHSSNTDDENMMCFFIFFLCLVNVYETEFVLRSLMAWGKKLLLSLSVFAIMLLKRLPDGSKRKRWLPGWVES